MGLPVNVEINGRYVLSQEAAGANSKIIVMRIADDAKQQLLMKYEWLNFFDGLCSGVIDQGMMETLCDSLFL